jgi:hypothetical protein
MALRCCDRGMNTVHFCCDESAMKYCRSHHSLLTAVALNVLADTNNKKVCCEQHAGLVAKKTAPKQH